MKGDTIKNIRQRGPNTFQIRFYLGKGADGKSRSLCKTIHCSKREAEKYARELAYKLEKGELLPEFEKKPSFAEFWESQQKADIRRLSPTTIERRAKAFARYLAPIFGAISINKIRPIDISNALALWSEKKLNPYTVRTLFAFLRAVFNRAIRLKIIAENPCQGQALPKKARRFPVKILNATEQAAFLETCDKAGALVLRFALLTGLRPSEYLGLTWQDFDLKNGLVRVQRSLKRTTERGYFFGELKTKSSNRAIYLDVDTLELLRKAYCLRRSSADLVFHNRKGGPLNLGTVQSLLARILEKAGLPHCRLYDLRHSHASLLLEKGIPVQAVATRLGHSSPNTTMLNYIHSRPEQGAQIAGVLSDLFSGEERRPAPSKNSLLPFPSAFAPALIDFGRNTEEVRKISTRSAFLPNLPAQNAAKAEACPLKTPILTAI